MSSQRHIPSDSEFQAEQFRQCFSPDAYELEQQFGWMSDQQRQFLGEKATEKLKEAYIETIEAIYAGDV